MTMPDPSDEAAALDRVEAQIAREEAEDARLTEPKERAEIVTYEGFSGTTQRWRNAPHAHRGHRPR